MAAAIAVVAGRGEWQRRLDGDFPRGAITSWGDGNPRSSVYLLPHVLVTAAIGGLPVVRASVFAGSDKVVGPWQVTSYRADRLTVVRFARVELPMLLSASVNRRLAQAMASERANSIRMLALMKGSPAVDWSQHFGTDAGELRTEVPSPLEPEQFVQDPGGCCPVAA